MSERVDFQRALFCALNGAIELQSARAKIAPTSGFPTAAMSIALSSIAFNSQPPEARLQLLPQVLHAQRPLIRSRKIAMGGHAIVSKLYCDVRDHDAVLRPQVFNLSLALVEKRIEVMYKQHPLTWGGWRTTPAEQYIVGALG